MSIAFLKLRDWLAQATCCFIVTTYSVAQDLLIGQFSKPDMMLNVRGKSYDVVPTRRGVLFQLC